MNAVLREEYEAPVLTNEAIEVHLSYLRPAVETLIKKVDQADKDRAAGDALLADKIAAGDALLADRMSAGYALLLEKIAAGDALLAEKIDQANKDRAAGDTLLAEKIDQANKDRAAGDTLLAEKIDQANRDRAAGDAMLADKIDKLGDRLMEMKSSQDGLKWFVSSLTIIASGFSIARNQGWI
jgi:hypothetical protein